MIFSKKGKDIPEKKLREWKAKYQADKLVEAMKNGSMLTRLKAIEVLSEINMSQVKREIIIQLEDKSEPIALKAADALESMGVTPEERELIKACRTKWKAETKKKD